MPAKPRSFAALAKAAERALREAGVDHVFVGSLAVAAFGVPRTTADLDVVVAYREEDAPALAEAFHRQGFQVSPEDLRDALAERSHCTVYDTRSAFRVDLAPVQGHADEDAIRQSVRVQWRGAALPVAAPEHTIVMKLVYGSEQDLEDALGIYVRQSSRLDGNRMREFARDQGVLQALRDLERRAVE